VAAKQKAKAPKAKQKALKAPKGRSKYSKFSAPQKAAYQKASRQAIQKAQFRTQVAKLQARRLQGAAKATRKLNLKYQQAVRARVKVLAQTRTYRQTVSGRQNRVLRVQAAHALFKSQSVATNRQFAYLGERIHRKTTVLQTVTTKQAANQVTSFRKQARKAAIRKQALKPVSGKRPGRPKRKTTRTKKSSAYTHLGKAAGLAAANSISARVKAATSSHKTPAKSKKRKAAVNQQWVSRGWITGGNTAGRENCVAVALANHMFLWTGRRMDAHDLDWLSEFGGDTLPSCLVLAQSLGLVASYERLWSAVPGSLIGYESPYGPHAGVLASANLVVSWGDVTPLNAEIEEAWAAEWLPSSR
jgi:hypothetical protein